MNARAPEKEVLAIAGPTGRIEALLEAPRNSPGTRVGVVCHPHPLHQGTMMNKVVYTIIQGDADDVVSCDEVVAWVNELQPGPELMVFPGAGHFFHGQLIQLRAALVDSLS
jgi:alpha/beta superfamily hydrolase